MKRVFIITQSDPFYIPKMIKVLAENQLNNYRLVGFTLLKPSRKNKSNYDWFKERFDIYNLKELFLVGFAFFYVKVPFLFFKKKLPYCSLRILKKHNIPHIETKDINSDYYIDKLKKLDIDIIISISSPQLFKQELIDVSKDCCLNAHGTLLPRHKGVFGSWWTLFQDDIIGGSSIHKLVLKLDSGEIIWQKSFKINSQETQYSIAYKTKRDMAFGFVEIFKNYNKMEKINQTANIVSSYHKAPSIEMGKLFHEKGKKIIKLTDIPNMLSNHF